MSVPSAAPYSYKEGDMLHPPSERFSPVRRASDGLSGVNKHQLSNLERLYNQTLVSQGARHSSQNSLKQLQHECHELQVCAQYGGRGWPWSAVWG